MGTASVTNGRRSDTVTCRCEPPDRWNRNGRSALPSELRVAQETAADKTAQLLRQMLAAGDTLIGAIEESVRLYAVDADAADAATAKATKQAIKALNSIGVTEQTGTQFAADPRSNPHVAQRQFELRSHLPLRHKLCGLHGSIAGLAP